MESPSGLTRCDPGTDGDSPADGDKSGWEKRPSPGALLRWVTALVSGYASKNWRQAVTDDERFMNRALELAAEVAFTSPNPKVGAVVVRDGQIIAEGTHRGPGTPHAEAVALRDIDARGASLYLNLEPCVHEGRMPTCTPAVIEAGISRVVVAIEDPDERVAGRGIALLRSSGVVVDVGICELQARGLNLAYLHQRTTKRPLVSLKLALSLDGKLAAADGSSADS